jgi:peroxiredoxin
MRESVNPERSRFRRGGLDVGEEAPDFELCDLSGRKVRLSDFRGNRVLLVFQDPGCGPCQELASELEMRVSASQRDSSQVQVVMVSRGGLAKNQEKARKDRITFPILLQERWEVSKLYATFAVPVAYVIDKNGLIENPVAVGPTGILALLEESPS